MLSFSTYLIILISMGGALWLAFYFFARGFPNPLAMRGSLALLSMAAFFWLTYNNFFGAQTQFNYLKLILLIIAMATWYSLTYQLLEEDNQRKLRILKRGIYSLFLLTVILLAITQPELPRRFNNDLYVAQLEVNFVYSLYSMTQLALTVGSIFNLALEKKIRFSSQGRLFLFSSLFITLAVGYGVISFFTPNLPLPRLVQDGLVFGGFFMLGLSALKYQSLLERRTIYQDFPLTLLVIVSVCFVYISLLKQETSELANLVGLVIITHSVYDLAREFLERYRAQQEKKYRRQVLQFTPSASQSYLQDALALFCAQIKTTAGIVAVQSAEKFVVTATHNSVASGSVVPHPEFTDATIEKSDGSIQNIAWVTSIFDGEKQIAFIGIGAPLKRLDYSTGELDLLQEFADYVNLMLLVEGGAKKDNATISYQAATEDMIENLSNTPDEQVVRMTEDGLRKFPDVVKLGQSELAKWLDVAGATHIERGKKVQRILREGVDALRPLGSRPDDEPLPRNWYNYAVLNDAYIRGVMNKEVMARLYISEGTFNRTRRNALRGVARWLTEKGKGN